MHHRISSTVRFFVALLLATLLPASSRADLNVRVVDSAAIMAWVQDSGTETFRSQSGLRVPLVLDPRDPAIVNPSREGRFFPVESASVEAAVQDLRLPVGPRVDVVIYCLPGLPRDVGRSFASGAEIFLAPGVGPLSPRVVAYTVVHELGHVVQRTLVPEDSRGFQRYLGLRGLTDPRYGPHAAHRDRPVEIFAEDFRALWGGVDATYSGTIENPRLPHPASVPGLGAFFDDVLEGSYLAVSAVVALGNFPNPFNPHTSIQVKLAADLVGSNLPVAVTIYDSRGRRIRRLTARASHPVVSVAWDGHDDARSPVASGRYFYRVHVAGAHASGRMLLLK